MKSTLFFTEQQITLRSNNGFSYVSFFEIRSFTFVDYLLTVNIENDKHIVTNYTLKEWLSLFPRKLFVRVNKQTYLNVYFLKHYCSVKQQVHLADCSKTLLASTFIKPFFKQLQQTNSPILVLKNHQTFKFINKAYVFLLLKMGMQTQINYLDDNIWCKKLVSEDIKSVCSELQDYDFRRCNQSGYINLCWCTGQVIERDTRKKYLILAKEVKVLVGRAFKENLEEPVRLLGQCENVVFRKLFCHHCINCNCAFRRNSDA